MEVRLDAAYDTVWLNRHQIAELFERDVKTIGKHINNALQEEVAVDSVGAKNATTQNKKENPTVAKFAIAQKEGTTKFNKLCINALKATRRLCGELCILLFGGSNDKFIVRSGAPE